MAFFFPKPIEYAIPSLLKITTCRVISSNQLTGSVEALGELTEMKKMCVKRAWLVFQEYRKVQYVSSSIEEALLRTSIDDGLLARRDIANNKFSGNIEALGKLKKIGALYDTLLSCRRGWIHGNARTFYLCLRRSIKKNKFEGSVKALENLVALTQLCVGVNCVSVMRGI